MKIATKEKDRSFLIGLLRAFAGAVIFSFPILMTMEMWALGYTISPVRLIVFVVLSVPLLIGLSYFVGFEETENLADDVIDAFVGYAVGFFTSALFLFILGIIDFSMSAYEVLGKISLQAVTAAIGAMFAQSQLGGRKDEKTEGEADARKRRSGYWGEIFIMLVGAIFLAMNPAATEEMYLIAYKMTEWQIILLAVLNIIGMHAFVYSVGFAGEESHGESSSILTVFLRFTIVGYALALSISFYLLWTFGSLEGLGLKEMLNVTIVLGFPAALGAAASRVII